MYPKYCIVLFKKINKLQNKICDLWSSIFSFCEPFQRHPCKTLYWESWHACFPFFKEFAYKINWWTVFTDQVHGSKLPCNIWWYNPDFISFFIRKLNHFSRRIAGCETQLKGSFLEKYEYQFTLMEYQVSFHTKIWYLHMWKITIVMLHKHSYMQCEIMFQHSNKNFLSPCSHVISSIYYQLEQSDNLIKKLFYKLIIKNNY